MKKEYVLPEIRVEYIEEDILTLSENEKWEGPVIDAAEEK